MDEIKLNVFLMNTYGFTCYIWKSSYFHDHEKQVPQRLSTKFSEENKKYTLRDNFIYFEGFSTRPQTAPGDTFYCFLLSVKPPIILMLSLPHKVQRKRDFEAKMPNKSKLIGKCSFHFYPPFLTFRFWLLRQILSVSKSPKGWLPCLDTLWTFLHNTSISHWKISTWPRFIL